MNESDINKLKDGNKTKRNVAEHSVDQQISRSKDRSTDHKMKHISTDKILH